MVFVRKKAILVVLIAAVVIAGAFAFYWFSFGLIGPGECPLPVPAIELRTVGGSGEMVFLSQYSSYFPQPLVSDLTYELARYQQGDDHLGPGTIFLAGSLSSLNTTGTFQFHDMDAEGEFSPGNDFFILQNPPPATVQLRILNATGSAIAWNPIVFCI